VLEIDKQTLGKIKSAKSVIFFTGAGVSAESGIPTFRGKDGIWNKLNPEELANFNAFIKNPQLVWEWYNHRKKIIHESKPNAAHYAIAGMEKLFDNVSVVTQNIDNLHKRAGSKNVFELHGNIERSYCIKCKTHYDFELDFSLGVPKCKCGGLIRPDVVWFGEFLPKDQYAASEKAARHCNLFFIVGTSAVVYPAAYIISTAKERGAFLIEINIEETEISSMVDKSFFGKAGEILPAIVQALRN